MPKVALPPGFGEFWSKLLDRQCFPPFSFAFLHYSDLPYMVIELFWIVKGYFPFNLCVVIVVVAGQYKYRHSVH